MTALNTWIRAMSLVKRSSGRVLPEILTEISYDRVALIGSETLTYADLACRINGYAATAIEQGIAGKTIALLMRNCPNYVAIWLGLTRVGCQVALLNTSLHPDSLMHCIRAVDASYLIGDAELTGNIDVPVIDLTIAPNGPDWPLPRPEDVALFIYTSGTTGLPKAAKITHRRITEWCYWFSGMTSALPNDRMYDCLPMYHSIGGIVAVGSMLVAHASVVIRPRFSATHFWDDVVETRCTIFQYIGELCRYLTSLPPQKNEREHQLRLAVGNGLQADVWERFQGRFGIPQVLEYYAATEGVLSLYNCEGKPGAIGHIPPILEPHFAIKLIRVDQETGEPMRDAGRCIVADIDEPGEAVTLLRNGRRFDGYNDALASDHKVLRDAFVAGDRWYRTGDLMRKDRAGFYYFVDRLGDTFRWKGENVSTTEVANVVRACPGVVDTVVYGVNVPENDGRAGMAAITTTDDFSFEILADHLRCHLPTYARPIFVRLCELLDTTGTFKLAKTRFVAEGYTSVGDPIYAWRDKRLVPFRRTNAGVDP